MASRAGGSPSLLVLDFDGTVTLLDTGDALCDRFAPPAWREADAAWLRGEVSLPDAQRRMWSLARVDRDRAVAAARELAPLRPGLGELLDAAGARGTPVWLASGGFGFYIEALLGDAIGRFERAWFNDMWFEGESPRPEFPHRELACGRCGVCKGRVCDLARATGRRVVFAGDGSSDRCALGRADVLAAVRGSRLAAGAAGLGVACVEFERLDELITLL